MKRGRPQKLTAHDMQTIRELYRKPQHSAATLALLFRVSEATILRVVQTGPPVSETAATSTAAATGMTPAAVIVRRLVAKKYPAGGRYCFEEHELVQLVEAIQQDAVRHRMQED